jgi:hypothetical protein
MRSINGLKNTRRARLEACKTGVPVQLFNGA